MSDEAIPVPSVVLDDGRSVRLGRRPPDLARMRTKLWLHDYIEAGAQPPDSADYMASVADALAEMLGNDRWGDCVIAMIMHAIGVFTGNGSGKAAIGTTAEAVDQYHGICGAGDRGCNIQDVLDHAKNVGITVGGNTYKILDYMAVDHTRRDMMSFGVYLSGAIALGVNLPNNWTSSPTWDVTNTRIVGGHGIPAGKYGPDGVTISTWGGTRLVTWPAMISRNWFEEAWLLVSQDFLSDSMLAKLGLKQADLIADLALVAAGQPPNITPTPPAWSYADQI